MRLISYRAIRQFADRHPQAREAMDRWFEIVASARWTSLAGIRRQFAACDPVRVDSDRTVYVFNVGGSKYRVLCAVHFNRQTVFILRVLTHDEYDKDAWKREL
jgi:mRNA interferase HigB